MSRQSRVMQKATFTVKFVKEGAELERYVVQAYNQGDAELEASGRFQKSHPELSIFDDTVEMLVEVPYT